MLVAAVIALGDAFACVSHHTTRDVELAPVRQPAGEIGIETPNLEGPDALDLAPLVALSVAGLAFDHEPIDRNGLEARLRTYRANFAVLHPGEPAPHEVLLACSPSISSQSIFSVLDTARLLGFDQARLVFENRRSRPSANSGGIPRTISAAQVALSDDAEPRNQTYYVRPSEVQNCAELSERVIALRRAGKAVTLAGRAAH